MRVPLQCSPQRFTFCNRSLHRSLPGGLLLLCSSSTLEAVPIIVVWLLNQRASSGASSLCARAVVSASSRVSLKCAPDVDLETGKRGSVPQAPLTLTDREERSAQHSVSCLTQTYESAQVRSGAHTCTHTHTLTHPLRRVYSCCCGVSRAAPPIARSKAFALQRI